MHSDAFGSLVERIHRTPLEPELWPSVMEAVSDALDCPQSGLIMRDLGIGALLLTATDPRASFEGMQAYRDYYASIDKLAAEAQRRPVGEVVNNEMLLSPSDMRRSEVWNDFYVPNGLDRSIGACAIKTDRFAASLVVYRDRARPDFARHDFDLMQRIVPHVTSALRCWLRIREADARAASSAGALDTLAAGVILLDCAGRVLWMNRAASAVVRSGDTLAVQRGVLTAPTTADARQLRRLVHEVATGTGSGNCNVLLAGRSAGPPLRVLATALLPGALDFDARVMVVLSPRTDTASLVTHVRQLWGLTPAEAALACAIAEGKSLSEIASDRSVTMDTIRGQWKSIRQKTGARTQSQLVRLLLTSPAAMKNM